MLPNLNAGLQYLDSEIKMENYSARLLSGIPRHPL